MDGMEKLLRIQQKLKAPKDKTGNGLRYSYRKIEDIIENAKPIMEEEKCCLIFADDVISIGDEQHRRFYVKSKAVLLDAETGKTIAESTALAREAEKEPGKGESQITGSATTYARKTAASGLFALDNSEKDADEEAADRANRQTVENTNQRMAGNRQTTVRKPNGNRTDLARLCDLLAECGYTADQFPQVAKALRPEVSSLDELVEEDIEAACQMLADPNGRGTLINIIGASGVEPLKGHAS